MRQKLKKLWGEELMTVYVVEEIGESCWGYYCEDTEVVGVYESKEKAITKKQELMELHRNRFKEYYITTYDTETGEEIND